MKKAPIYMRLFKRKITLPYRVLKIFLTDNLDPK